MIERTKKLAKIAPLSIIYLQESITKFSSLKRIQIQKEKALQGLMCSDLLKRNMSPSK